MKSPYFFDSIVDEVRPHRATGWEWIDSHPRMETPPVCEPLEREVVDQSISRGEWCLFVAGVLFGVLGASLFV